MIDDTLCESFYSFLGFRGLCPSNAVFLGLAEDDGLNLGDIDVL